MTVSFDLIIIGAGAAGLMCAATAGKRGKSVLVLDHANKACKKVLMSGGGKCNFTNLSIEPDNFISSNSHFCKSALKRYTQWDFISLVEKYGIEYYEKSKGQLFCKSSSKDIRDLLLSECQKVGAKIQLKTDILKITQSPEGDYLLNTSNGLINCSSLVIATGGLSIPTMGASGYGYKIAEQFGHRIISTRAGLTPVLLDKDLLLKTSLLAGNSVKVTASCENTYFTDAMLFTHKGLSGPAILQISNYWQNGEQLHINFLPEIDADVWLDDNIKQSPKINLKTLLSRQFSQSIANFFITLLKFNPKIDQLSKVQRQEFLNLLTDWKISPKDVQGYKVAEVTLGGIDTGDISSKTFESNLHKGLYFIGEVLDVTGHLGGYNFQWAWSSGYAAGMYV
ncbi:MAG: NAD(P)/FAD-dependent oxidoreductase [Gammaproteobacteria bacterium]|nr:NAD(P)/FAD-dependent oxidoreductase [Gammaproteobacteria bacterium]